MIGAGMWLMIKAEAAGHALRLLNEEVLEFTSRQADLVEEGPTALSMRLRGRRRCFPQTKISCLSRVL